MMRVIVAVWKSADRAHHRVLIEVIRGPMIPVISRKKERGRKVLESPSRGLSLSILQRAALDFGRSGSPTRRDRQGGWHPWSGSAAERRAAARGASQ